MYDETSSIVLPHKIIHCTGREMISYVGLAKYGKKVTVHGGVPSVNSVFFYLIITDHADFQAFIPLMYTNSVVRQSVVCVKRSRGFSITHQWASLLLHPRLL